jgi:hypothetical protein
MNKDFIAIECIEIRAGITETVLRRLLRHKLKQIDTNNALKTSRHFSVDSS